MEQSYADWLRRLVGLGPASEEHSRTHAVDKPPPDWAGEAVRLLQTYGGRAAAADAATFQHALGDYVTAARAHARATGSEGSLEFTWDIGSSATGARGYVGPVGLATVARPAWAMMLVDRTGPWRSRLRTDLVTSAPTVSRPGMLTALEAVP